jgi:hypothetical protein
VRVRPYTRGQQARFDDVTPAAIDGVRTSDAPKQSTERDRFAAAIVDQRAAWRERSPGHVRFVQKPAASNCRVDALAARVAGLPLGPGAPCGLIVARCKAVKTRNPY